VSPRLEAWSRRRVLATALAGTAVVIGGGAVATGELVDHGVLPGKLLLDHLDGDCSVSRQPFEFAGTGTAISGSFNSKFRHRTVGYTLAFPPGHQPGSPLPLVLMLHGYGANHTDALSGLTPAQAVALRVNGRLLAPTALVTVDGGDGYWNPHPGDDPMSMVVEELIPRCQELGAGRRPQQIGAMGVSMGGYGALLFGERFPAVFSAVAAISPAIWTSFAQARTANPGAYATAADFAACDVVTHSAALSDTPVRIASGMADPFHPGVMAMSESLGSRADVVFTSGCHTGTFFASQEPASLAFLAHHLS